MSLPAAQGLSVIYVLADEWTWRRGVLRLLGADDPAPLDAVLDRPVRRTGVEDRVRQVEAAGGETVGEEDR
jgi:hypothetical protein